MGLRGLFQRKNDGSEEFVDEITIVDGQVVSLVTDDFSDTESPTAKASPDESFSDESSREGENPPEDNLPGDENPSDKIPSPTASSSEQPLIEFPATEILLTPLPKEEEPDQEEEPYLPCYLVDGTGEDYTNFLEHLKQEGKTKGTQAEYGVNLRHWRVALNKLSNGHSQLSIEHLNDILQSVSSVKALRMKYSLSAYAKYRRKQGDPRLFALLTEHAEDIFTPSRAVDPKQERHPNDRLTKEEMDSYEDLGRYLCQKGRREGIWVSLCLLGVKPCEVKELAFPNKSSVGFMRRGKPRVIKIPHWLYKAMQAIPEEKWRLNRRVIYRDVSALGANPNVLNAAARAREKQGARRKKEEEQDIQRMMKQWRRNRSHHNTSQKKGRKS